MSEGCDSIYPEILQSGLGKLRRLGVYRELSSLFQALEHLRGDLHAQETAPGILEASQRYISGLNLFRSTAFFLVNAADYDFELVLCRPDDQAPVFKELMNQEVAAGRFARALRACAPVFFESETDDGLSRGVFHVLALPNRVVGMFCGLLKDQPATAQEISFSLLSLLLGTSTDALATLTRTTQLKNEIKTLSGLLPICAWCKKVRGDKGYWAQIEEYVEKHSDASFSHGICPDCMAKFLKGQAAKSRS